jgi:CRP-like cAMP-binding protein
MGDLGTTYKDGEVIFREGEVGDCMYVIQAGRAEVLRQKGENMVRLGILKETDFFGEMAIFEREARSATVRALGDVRVLTVDKKSLLRRISQDPTMAFRLMQSMSNRIRELNAMFTRVRAGDRRKWETRPEVWNGER